MSEPTDYPWYLYLIRCADGSLYTGITTDVQRRLAEHQGAASRSRSVRQKGAKALRGKGPLSLAFQMPVANRSIASKLEYRVKQLSKPEKEMLVAGNFSTDSLLQQSQ